MLQYSEIISVQGSQTSKTDGLLINVLGWKLDIDPGPILFFGPSEKNLKSISDRIKKMILSVPKLSKSLDKRRDNRFEKYINGVRLGLGTARSKTDLSSNPASLVLFDEIGDIDNIVGQGNPYLLAKARGSTYPEFCQIGCGSPAVGEVGIYKHPETGIVHWAISNNVSSFVWQQWQAGTRHEFMLPCPKCGIFFAPRLRFLKFPETDNFQKIEQDAFLECPYCQHQITQEHQHRLIKNGLPIAPGEYVINGTIKGQPPNVNTYSMFVSGLCSVWQTWGQRAADYVRAVQSDDEGQIQAIINTHFGECYHQIYETSWEQLKKLKADYLAGTIPANVKIITIYADVQEEALVWTLAGWDLKQGEDNERPQIEFYVIDYGYMVGNTFEPDVWQIFLRYTETEFGVPLKSVGLDSGYNPSRSARAKLSSQTGTMIPQNVIYDFARKNPNIIITKGSSRPQSRPYRRTLVDTTRLGRALRSGLELWWIDTDHYKTAIYKKLSQASIDVGRWYLPSDVSDDFLKQITAEYKDSKTNLWKFTRDNHYLDTVVGHMFLSDLGDFKTMLQEDNEIDNDNQPTGENDNDWNNWENSSSSEW